MILIKNDLHYLMLKRTLEKKKFSLQFLPEKLENIKNEKKLVFDGKNLKTAYLIDIVHNLILKYYFKRDNSFNLNAQILKEKYGHLYNYYINWLVSNNVIFLKRNYYKGSNSRVYSLHESVLNNKIGRWENSDKILIKKYINRYHQYELDKNDFIPKEIKNKLVLDLYSVKIQYERSLFYLNSLKSESDSIYNRNIYSVEAINDSHIFYHFDNYGRMHSNFTILKSFIRKNCLLIDNEETTEIDVPNSQPLFLSKLINQIQSRWVNKDELDLFSTLVYSGNFYQYLIDELKLKNKIEAKQITYKVLFGKNLTKSVSDKKFEKLFPTIHLFIKLYKKEHKDYKVLSHTLQRMESELIFKEVVKTIMLINSDIKLVTIHDSIIAPLKYKDIVQSVFYSKLKENFPDNFNLIYN